MLKPLDPSAWNYKTALHLCQRAGFGGSPEEITRVEKLGLAGAVAWFLDYDKFQDPTPAPAWAKPDPELFEKRLAMRKMSPDERRMAQQELRRTQREQMMDLRNGWLRRMLLGVRPLQEKMVLFWHGHFATSMEKVKNTYFMWLQNETFRKHATGAWLDLHLAIAKDPAMLIYLDQARSRKESPNENYAREVMELFALGEGHYSEKDITEAARAFTGWSLNPRRQTFEFRQAMHDPGNKTVLGRTGNLGGAEVLQQILAQPQAAKFITFKLWTFFAGSEPTPELADALAQTFRKSGSRFAPLLRSMFLSEAFYADGVVGSQIKSPVQWLIGSLKVLNRPIPEGPATAQILRTLGQDLFAPPNVKGWDGGPAWITTSSLLARYNFAATLVEGDNSVRLNSDKKLAKAIENRLNRRFGDRTQVDLQAILPLEHRKDPSAALNALETRFLVSPLKGAQRETLQDHLKSSMPLDDADCLQAIRLIMSTPQYQLC